MSHVLHPPEAVQIELNWCVADHFSGLGEDH